jgi:dihydroorotate dehydrogenase (fumarate)
VTLVAHGRQDQVRYYQTVDLTTTYLGIKLRTPLVPSASPLSEEIGKVKQMEQAGAPAVVLHSLFEEQIETDSPDSKPEFRVAPDIYLKHIAEAKRCVKIPIIASLNCTRLDAWLSYARRIAEAGADALELNIYNIPTDMEQNGAVRYHNPAGGETQSVFQQFRKHGAMF